MRSSSIPSAAQLPARHRAALRAGRRSRRAAPPGVRHLLAISAYNVRHPPSVPRGNARHSTRLATNQRENATRDRLVQVHPPEARTAGRGRRREVVDGGAEPAAPGRRPAAPASRPAMIAATPATCGVDIDVPESASVAAVAPGREDVDAGRRDLDLRVGRRERRVAVAMVGRRDRHDLGIGRRVLASSRRCCCRRRRRSGRAARRGDGVAQRRRAVGRAERQRDDLRAGRRRGSRCSSRSRPRRPRPCGRAPCRPPAAS